MTIKDMHIGIDLIIQRLNSNFDADIQPEAKDYFINNITTELVRSIILNEDSFIKKLIEQKDIDKFYIGVQNYIRQYKLNIVDYGHYCTANLPISNNKTSSISSGTLINGVKYNITTVGNTDLSNFGYNGIDNTFTCTIKKIYNVTGLYQFYVGKYKILHKGILSDFTAVNIVNNIFIIPDTQQQPPITLDSDTVIQPLEQTPIWDTVTKLTQLDYIGYYLPINSISLVENPNAITSGKLKLNTKYVIHSVTSILPDISNVDEYGIKNANIGYIFKVVKSGNVIFNDAVLYELYESENNLVEFSKFNKFITNSFGIIKSNPISVIYDNKLKVYYGLNFKVYDVDLNYIIKPREVDINNNINSDFNESLHYLLIELVSKYILLIFNRPEAKGLDYQIHEKIDE